MDIYKTISTKHITIIRITILFGKSTAVHKTITTTHVTYFKIIFNDQWIKRRIISNSCKAVVIVTCFLLSTPFIHVPRCYPFKTIFGEGSNYILLYYYCSPLTRLVSNLILPTRFRRVQIEYILTQIQLIKDKYLFSCINHSRHMSMYCLSFYPHLVGWWWWWVLGIRTRKACTNYETGSARIYLLL